MRAIPSAVVTSPKLPTAKVTLPDRVSGDSGPIALQTGGRMRFFLFLAGLVVLSAAQASEIAVAPLRRVITADQPVAEFRVTNPSDRYLEARLSWIDLAAAYEGYVQATPKQRQSLSAAPYLTLRPAFVRIEPGGSAVVAVALKPGTKPPAGERRSHLLIETGAARSPIRKTSGLELDIGLGVSTPVILRGGKLEAAAKIAAARFLRSPDGLLLLETTIEPEGAYSAYGRLIAEFSAPNSNTQTLGEVRNVSAYVDAKKRVYSVPLKVRSLPTGVLTLRFVGAEEFEGRVFARRTFAVSEPAD